MFHRVAQPGGGGGGGIVGGSPLMSGGSLRLKSSVSFDENSTTTTLKKTTSSSIATPSAGISKRRAFGDISNRKAVREITNNNIILKPQSVTSTKNATTLKPTKNNKSVSFAPSNTNKPTKTPFGIRNAKKKNTSSTLVVPSTKPTIDATIPPKTPSRSSTRASQMIGNSIKTPSSAKTAVFRSSTTTTASSVPQVVLKHPELEFDEIKSAGRGWDKWDEDDDDSVLSLEEYMLTYSEMKRNMAKQRMEKRKKEDEAAERKLRIELEDLALADKAYDLPGPDDDISYGSIDLCLAFDEDDDPAMERYPTEELLW